MGTPIDPTKTPTGPYMSSNNIKWQGPDIPCINLCKGDNITDVVYKLATQLCEQTQGIIDITTLDFKCVVEGTAPETLVATIQALIDKICVVESGIIAPDVYTEPVIELPLCLQYTDGEDLITQLPQSEYTLHLAVTICDTITSINNLVTNYNALSNRVTTLENAFAALPDIPAEITVNTSTCLGSGTNVGIALAFASLDTLVCDLKNTLGSDSDLIAAIAKQCTGLTSEAQLNNVEGLMSDLTGWASSPGTIADTIKNLWLTICDMREKMKAMIEDMAVVPCITNPVASLTTTPTVDDVTVDWTAPIGSSELPSAYTIVFKNASGGVVYTKTVAGTVYTYVHSLGLTHGTTYTVEVTPIYACGTSTATTDEFALVCNNCSFTLKVIDSAGGTGVGGNVTIAGVVYNENTTDIATTGVNITTDCYGTSTIYLSLVERSGYQRTGVLTWQGTDVLTLTAPGTPSGSYGLACVEGGVLTFTITETAL